MQDTQFERHITSIQEPIRVLIFIPAYGRHEITALCYESINRCLPSYPITGLTFTVLCVVSNAEDRALAHEHGFSAFNALINQPLGEKKNRGIEFAMETKWDFLLEMDSDTLVNPAFVSYYLPMWKRKCPMFGTNRMGFLDMDTGAMLDHITIGELWITGRSMSRELVEEVLEDEGCLWTPEAERCLGWDNHARVNRVKGPTFHFKEVFAPDLLFLDMKRSDNITPFHALASSQESRQVIGEERERLLQPFAHQLPRKVVEDMSKEEHNR